jgi:anti-anti-sigma regulatory factor
MLQIEVTQEANIVALGLSGVLDGQTYQSLMTKAQEIYKDGAKNIVIDLSQLNFISSAGLVALHFIALLANGENLPDTENGWAALKSAERSRASGLQKNVKLLNPRPEVLSVLEMVGFSSFFEIFTEKQKALDSFS